jgi:hypothetical protein
MNVSLAYYAGSVVCPQRLLYIDGLPYAGCDTQLVKKSSGVTELERYNRLHESRKKGKVVFVLN